MVNQRQRNLLLLSSSGLILLFGLYYLIFSPLWSVPATLPGENTLISTTLYDRHGYELQIPLNSRQERASQTDLQKVPPSLQYAFLLSEDKRFYQHLGVDFKALIRAARDSIKQGRIVSGASTITMQLSRIYWPHLARSKNKLAQIIQALRLERNHTKPDILKQYLSLVPFGHQVTGIERACTYFFNKTCERLSLSESATIAILPRSPNYYFKNKTALMRARNQLIRKISGQMQIDKISYQQAMNEPIKFQKGKLTKTAYHFVHKVLQKIQNFHLKEVHTTLDRNLQNKIQSLLKEDVEYNQGLGDTGAILIVENKTGEVITYVGSPDYFHSKHGMLDAVQTKRSPGSALKPFLYAYALEKGYTLATVLPDIPISFQVASGIFSPDNYGGNFSGPVQMRYALANSKNIPSLYLTKILGEPSVLNFFKKSGIKSLDLPASHYGVGLSLGNGEVSLWELVQAYASFSNDGYFLPLKIFKLENNNFLKKKAFSRQIAYLISHNLSDPEARAEEFGRGGPLEFDFKVAVKTGTSNNFRDHWILGFTPKYTIGVWKGNADNKSFAYQVPSAKGLGPLFRQIVLLLHKDKNYLVWNKPKNIVAQTVCSLSGHLPGPHCEATRLEVFRKNHMPTKICDQHKQIEIAQCRGEKRLITYVDLPKEYDGWAKSSQLPTLGRQLKMHCGYNDDFVFRLAQKATQQPKIISPISGTLFAYDPRIPKTHQKLRVEFANTNTDRPISLYINDKPIRQINNQSHFDWTLERGVHDIKLKVENEKPVDSVKIKVF